MSKVTLAPRDLCTACGACMVACTKQSISMESDVLGCLYPVVDETKCIVCGLCQKSCPVLKPQQVFPKGQVYVAWNTDEQLRSQAASGGVATAIYQYALSKGMKTFGVECCAEGETRFIPINNREDIQKCRNSKYVYTDISPILKQIKQLVKTGEQVILPALPCQIAAILAYIGGERDNLILIDIICHGVCPSQYLEQHIAAIAERKKKKAETILFRDPKFGTNRFVFSLYEKDRCFYHVPVHADDVYQLGYHKALTYRENCYHCNYAMAERLGDLTIADFSGLGRRKPFSGRRDSVSCVIVSSQVGEELIKSLQAEGFLACEPRPAEEAFAYEKQLQKPSAPHEGRQQFLQAYSQYKSFDLAAKQVLYKDVLKNNLRGFFRIEQLKGCVSGLLPKKVKALARRVIVK